MHPTEVSELYGTYIAEHQFGTERLVLQANGEYVQEITVRDRPGTVTASGKWSYDVPRHYITLKKLLIAADVYGRLRKDYNVLPEGDSVLPVTRYPFGSLRIGSEEGVLYRRVLSTAAGRRARTTRAGSS